MGALLDLELLFIYKGAKRGNFLWILHNILELEDKAQSKLAQFCKDERQYDLLGVSKGPQVLPKMIAAAPPMTPGCIDDLLKKR